LALAAIGFGHVEVGGVTAEAQEGNPRPRMFRLRPDRALINRMGFNNEGADAVGARLDDTALPHVPVGVNLGKSKSTPLGDAPADYRYTYERVADAADYFVINVSSPNTPGLRSLQNRDSLEAIVDELQDAGAAPLLVKLSPDLPGPAIEESLDVVAEKDLDGVVVANTTTERPESLQSPSQAEPGGLSGDPIEERSTGLVGFVAERTDVPVVGVGGVSDAEGAYRKIRAGADVVQLYTGLVYEGPSLAREINEGLLDLLERDGFDHVSEAVGADL
ncbi:quinone-dependent dihydroorotate dehydrogenase, partial [Halolamina salina]|uniref:quinone-dependent dihydroorotate dehydrogenase n=1 Tax=Halolamina salina TaxID=1220023 RepID=UPI003615AD7C